MSMFRFNIEENMKIIEKITCIVLLSLGATFLNAANFEGNFALTNDYIWRGMTQTGEDLAYSGGVDVTSDTGVYVGVWGSNVDFGANDNSSYEIDAYFGYADESERGISFDTGYISYNYPGGEDIDFEEVYLGLGYKWVGLTLSFGLDEAPNNTEWSVNFGDSGFGVTYGDYDQYGKYTLVSYDFTQTIFGFSIGIALSEFDAEIDGAQEDGFVITFAR